MLRDSLAADDTSASPSGVSASSTSECTSRWWVLRYWRITVPSPLLLPSLMLLLALSYEALVLLALSNTVAVAADASLAEAAAMAAAALSGTIAISAVEVTGEAAVPSLDASWLLLGLAPLLAPLLLPLPIARVRVGRCGSRPLRCFPETVAGWSRRALLLAAGAGGARAPLGAGRSRAAWLMPPPLSAAI